jgi:trimeric autotransporter adhesin
MNQLAGHLGIAIALAGSSTLPVRAQTTDTQTPASTTAADLTQDYISGVDVAKRTVHTKAIANTAAPELIISPRFGVGFSTSGGGYDSFTKFEGFVPLQQKPGSSLTFVQGKVLVDDDSHLGTNLLLGHRYYSPEGDRIIGGYIGYNTRDTGKNNFNQLGVGFESLGNWDFRANAYIPLGKSRRLAEETVFDTGVSTSNFGFFDHFLGTQTVKQNQITRRFETAMAGFDGEVGIKLAQIGEKGDIRGYLGGYYYDAPASNDILGWKARLEARPTDYLNLGLSVQNDNTFGTNVAFTVGTNFPGTRPRRNNSSQQIQARLGEPIARQENILVNKQVESKFTYTTTKTPVTNPETGQPYVFQQVNLNGTAGDGREENPANKVQDGLNATKSDGNHIVYVQGTSQTIRPFTIPNRVQVLSTGPVQQVLTREFGLVTLPRSNSEIYPSVTDTIKVGNASVLSGFNIAGATGAGVEAQNIDNAIITENFISSSNNAAVSLENTTGTITLKNNSVTGNGVTAFKGRNINTVEITNTNFTSNNSTTDGISLNGVTGKVDFANHPVTITKPAGNGISLDNISGSVEFSNGGLVINNPTGNGISVDNASGTVKIAANNGQINNPGQAGVSLKNSPGTLTAFGLQINNAGNGGIVGETVNNVTLENNQITQAQNQGISLKNSDGNFNIAGNTITDTKNAPLTASSPPQGRGIELNSVTGTVNIKENTITNTNGSPGNPPITADSGQGIYFDNYTGNVNLNIGQNKISNNYQNGVFIGLGVAGAGDATANIAITNNTIENNGLTTLGQGEGIGIGLENSAVVNSLTISGNTIRSNGHDGIDIRLGLLPSNVSIAQVQNGIISNNTIENNKEKGIQIQALDLTQGSFNLSNNIIRTSTDDAINFLSGFGGRLVADIQSNSITSNKNVSFIASTFPANASQPKMCLNLQNNSNNKAYQLVSLPGSRFAVVNSTSLGINNNNGFFTLTPSLTNISNLAACP